MIAIEITQTRSERTIEINLIFLVNIFDHTLK